MLYSEETFGVTSYDGLDLSSLPSEFHPPKDLKVEYFTRAKRQIRTASVVASENVDAQVIIVLGNQEPLEKYFEFINYLSPHKHNWAVHIMEPFSQGGSGRYLGAEDYIHTENFDYSVDDLHYFIDAKAKMAPNKPIVLIGHSKGGHFCIRYLEQAGADTPITSAFVTSPMMGLSTKTEIAEPYVQWLVSKGKAKEPIRGNDVKRLIKLSDDPFRRKLHHNWIDIGSYKPTHGVTTGWLKNAYISMRKARNPDKLRQIAIPVVVAYGEHEKVVSKKYIEYTIDHIPNCYGMKIYQAKHDPLKGVTSIRERLASNIRHFIIDQTLPKKPNQGPTLQP